MTIDLGSLLEARRPDKFGLYSSYINPQRVASLRRSGAIRNYVSGEGCYLLDDKGERYLDCDAGYGVFSLGRNHPAIASAISSLLDLKPANMVSRDVGLLAGLVAERLAARAPGTLNKVLFTNSGSETTEAALKFARRVTGRTRFLYLEGDFHGATYGALSVSDTGDSLKKMSQGFEPLLPGCTQIRRDDAEQLAQELGREDVAALVFEPVQGATAKPLSAQYLRTARDLCTRYGTVLIADEVLTGLGRTGRFLACEHSGIVPDMLLLSKALSGGCVPVGALMVREDLHAKAYSHQGAFVHGSTFGENDFGMAAALATLDALESGDLIANARQQGNALLEGLRGLQKRFEMIADVRGEGLLIGIEFSSPRAWGSRLTGAVLRRRGLLGHLMLLQLLIKHHVIASTAARNNVLRFHPPLTLSSADVATILTAFESVLEDTYRFPDGIGRFILSRVLDAGRTRPERQHAS